ncbi:MAG TPA: Ig domain-containing protein [Thermoanaerobaculia bacterium]|nr:Ig domain-containing protein [Thermoanaerobaculia bacterium]
MPLLALGSTLFLLPPAARADILVDGTTCTLAQAVNAANKANCPASFPAPDVGSCAAASGGSNTIQLSVDVNLSAVDNYLYGPNGLPPVASTITIVGNGHTISRSSSPGTPPFRLFYVSGGWEVCAGILTLDSLTLSGGLAQGGSSTTGGGGLGAGGAIFNQGTVHLVGVTITQCTARGGGPPSAAGAAGGGGMGGDAPASSSDGGSFGGAFPGTGGVGGGASATVGGGGGGFVSGADGVGGAGGGKGGFGGVGANPTVGDGGDGGSASSGGSGGGGSFGAGGGGGSSGGGGGGGGGVGGGGGGVVSSIGTSFGGHGGFGGGGGQGGGSGGSGGFGGGGGGGGSGCAGCGNNAGGSGGFGGGGGSRGRNPNPPGNGHGGGGAGMGGAIFNMGASTGTGRGALTAVNSTLSGNVAQGGSKRDRVPSGFVSFGGDGMGGGILNLDGSVSLTHCTIAFNAAISGSGISESGRGFAQGSEIFNLAFGNNVEDGSAATATLTLLNSIVGPDTFTDAFSSLDSQAVNGNHTNTATVSADSHDIVFSGTGYTPAVPPLTVDPLLGPLQSNGGPTSTMALGVFPESPALDLGDPAACVASDQRGVLRPQGIGCDIGAYEQGQLAVQRAGTGTGQVLNDGTNGINCGPTCSSGFAAMTTKVIAEADTGSFFAGWSSNCAGGTYDSRLTNQPCVATFSSRAPAITSANSTMFTVGNAGEFMVTSTGNPLPTISETVALPAGLSLSSSASGTLTLHGTPHVGTGGFYNLLFKATNSWPPDASQSFTLLIGQAPAITSGNGVTFTVGSAGTFAVTAIGVPGPTLSESGDALPGGVTFDPTTGVLSGTPNAGTGGTYHVVLKASNGVSPDASQDFTLRVQSGSLFTVAPCRLFDSRTAGGPLASGETRLVPVAGVCAIPATAVALSANVTVTQPSGDGDLALFPSNLSPQLSLLNFRAGQSRANNAILQLATDGSGNLFALAFVTDAGTVHLLVDVNGYLQ